MKKNGRAVILATEQDGIPVIACHREHNQLVFHCPFCGRTHYHGGYGEFGDANGYRVPHCPLPSKIRSYYLKEVKDPRLAGIK